MYLPNFTLFNLLGTVWFIIAVFAVAKLLTLDWEWRGREFIYFIAAACAASVVSVLNRDIYFQTPLSLGDLAKLIILYIYFRKIKAYPRKKAVILTTITIYVFIVVLYFLLLIYSNLVSLPGISFSIDFLPDTTDEVSVMAILQVFFYLPFFAFPTMLIAKFTQSSRQIINESKQLQNIFMYVGIGQLIIYTALVVFWRAQEYNAIDRLVSNNAIVIVSFGISILLGLYLYIRYINTRNNRRQKEAEQRSLQYYVNELEQQQAAMQKFKHDYHNILMSMDVYIQDKDIAGLEQYFSSKIKPASETITKNNFALQGLGKIKVREIKSIIAAKIMQAQSMNTDIDIKFEANEDIEHIPIDSVALVRMLGIILDNAIEALTELGSGKLFVAVHKWEAGITFTVQNTCSTDMPPVYQVLKPGFSTKDKSRGIGLSNLMEIVDANPNVIRETKIENGSFIQRLLIENGEETT